LIGEDDGIADLPAPPYYAVIFTSLRADEDADGYGETAGEMLRLAAEEPGYLGIESARAGMGITISYWRDLDAIARWKRNADHLVAQRRGREGWYERYAVRIARVERAYGFSRAGKPPDAGLLGPQPR
jgi:heme-degrading monooxygenase HmoA